jgi:hypothetical protein
MALFFQQLACVTFSIGVWQGYDWIMAPALLILMIGFILQFTMGWFWKYICAEHLKEGF